MMGGNKLMIATRLQSPAKAGDFIPVKNVYGSGSAFSGKTVENLLKGPVEKMDTHHHDATGKDMWLVEGGEEKEISVTFEFGGSYPVGEMWIWNYNQHSSAYPGLFHRGLKEVKIEHSLDGENWTDLQGAGYPYRLAAAEGNPQQRATNLDNENHSPVDFEGALARFVKISAPAVPGVGNWGGFDGKENLYGLSQVNFYAGQGLAVEPSVEWTSLFHQKQDWSGSDGIYAIPFNGCDQQGTAGDTKTIFIFGDTFVGAVDEATDYRLSTKMINNSLGILDGGEPKVEAMQFKWNLDEVSGQPASIFVPATPKGLAVEKSYYWLQDGTSIGGTFYCFPMIIGPNPDGPEGFEFAVHGVTCVSAPIGEEGPILELQSQVDTPLYFNADNGRNTYFGAGVMANTEEAGTPNPDGFVYIYGLQHWDNPRLVVARVLEGDFTNFDQWMFWDGVEWTSDMGRVVPIANEISCELSVSPMIGGSLDGKYVAVFQGVGNWLSMYAADSPVGPFENAMKLYYCSEPAEGAGIYTYNAKGHPHISKPGELLVSYNVNTTSWAAHEKHASIYRPRFLNVREIE
jgi:hypothetical protein